MRLRAYMYVCIYTGERGGEKEVKKRRWKREHTHCERERGSVTSASCNFCLRQAARRSRFLRFPLIVRGEGRGRLVLPQVFHRESGPRKVLSGQYHSGSMTNCFTVRGSISHPKHCQPFVTIARARA